MTNGIEKQRAARRRTPGSALLAAGLAFPLCLGAADPPPAASTNSPAKSAQAAPVAFPAFREKTTSGLRPDDFPLRNLGSEDFRSAAPPFISAPPPDQGSPVAPSKEEQESFRKQKNWILERSDNSTSPEAVRKLFKYDDFKLAGTDDKTKERTSWMDDYMDAVKPAKPASKGTDRTRDRDRDRSLDLQDESKPGKESSAKPKTDRQAFQDAEDKWSMILERASATAFSDQETDAGRTFRPDTQAATDFQKQQAMQRKEISQMLNLPDEQTLNPRQSIGDLELGLGGLAPQLDQFNLGGDRGLLRPASSGSLSSTLPTASLDGAAPSRNPSLNFQPGAAAASVGPSPNTFSLPTRPTFQQPAILPIPTRPGFITPQQF